MLHGNRQGVPRGLGRMLVAIVLAGCGVSPTPSTAPSGEASVTPEIATPVPRCPAFAFDSSAPLGPEFQSDIFEHDESKVITSTFLEGLAQVYAGADPCRWFTDAGLRAALAVDPRLREVRQGTLKVDGKLVLRVAFEGVYDLRRRPPTDPIDAIFDIAAGATLTDIPSHTATTTITDQRVALHIDFRYDGHRWWADGFGPVSADNAQWAAMPTALPPGPPCTGFVGDRIGAAFDDKAGEGHRVWCDADGRGRVVRQPDELAFLTRYPCGQGHAAVLTIGHPLGAPIDPLVRYEFVRDPAGEFRAQGWLTSPYRDKSTLPDDAASSGWTNGNIEIWMSPAEFPKAIYIRRGETVERWPRATSEWGVTDCN